MKHNHTLSIVVPIYNVEKYLEKCIDSVLTQTYQDIQVILVDDGSTDRSGIICDEYLQKDDRICVIHKKNGGLISARYEGVCTATGKYVTFVDSDDWIDNHMYESLMEHAMRTNADIVMSAINRYYSDDSISKWKFGLEEGYYNKKDIENKIIPTMLWNIKKDAWDIDPSLWSKIYKKELILEQLKQVKELDIYYAEDTVTIFPLLLLVESVYITNESFYFHRQRKKGTVAGYIKDPLFFHRLHTAYKYLWDVFSQTSYASVLQKQLDYFLMNSVRLKEEYYLPYDGIRRRIFPYYLFQKEDSVILYGAGKAGCSYKEQNDKYGFCNIVLWVDKNYNHLLIDDKIMSPTEINKTEYDYVLIAVENMALALEIKEELIQIGIPTNKIVWGESRARIIGDISC